MYLLTRGQWCGHGENWGPQRSGSQKFPSGVRHRYFWWELSVKLPSPKSCDQLTFLTKFLPQVYTVLRTQTCPLDLPLIPSWATFLLFTWERYGSSLLCHCSTDFRVWTGVPEQITYEDGSKGGVKSADRDVQEMTGWGTGITYRWKWIRGVWCISCLPGG